MAKLVIDSGKEWSFSLLEQVTEACQEIADNELGLDYYPPQIEVITAEQMQAAYTAVGMPVTYYHWSFGKRHNQIAYDYEKGRMGLAYEIVSNSNPCIAYCMEENTLGMQALVIAHASYGHNSFFKNNYLFKRWTHADSIIDYLVYARDYILTCEERYGYEEVTRILDACHALSEYSVYSYKRPPPLTEREIKKREHDRWEYEQQNINLLWSTIPTSSQKKEREETNKNLLKEPQENILRFIRKYSPVLEEWQREILRIICYLQQYFFPQGQTQVLNEGFACFTHYSIMQRLHEKGILTDGGWLEFIHSHTGVIYQPPVDSQYYSGINPYALGFALYNDVKRICIDPTQEDRQWFPHLVGHDCLEVIKELAYGFRDEGGLLQYLSPQLIRDMKLFSVVDDQREKAFEISHIHDEEGYRTIRQILARQYERSLRVPKVEVVGVRWDGDRILRLKHTPLDNRLLEKDDTRHVLAHAAYLWGFEVWLETGEGTKIFKGKPDTLYGKD